MIRIKLGFGSLGPAPFPAAVPADVETRNPSPQSFVHNLQASWARKLLFHSGHAQQAFQAETTSKNLKIQGSEFGVQGFNLRASALGHTSSVQRW